MDILDDILDTLNLEGALYFRTDFSGPWAVTVPQHLNAARFHFVLQGSTWVEIEGGPRLRLSAGDLLMIPRGRSHVLADREGRQAPPLETVLADAGYDGRGVLAVGAGDPGAETQMVCGHFSFRSRAEHPILKALPDHVLITAAMRLQTPWLDDLLRLIGRRAFAEGLGAQGSVRRLSEIVFAEVIRTGHAADDRLGTVLKGFTDPQIGRALELIHADPARDWSVGSLASEVAMSRSVFAERFRSLVGVAPMSYVTDWRLQKALALLEDERRPVQQVAAMTGYRSSAAFSRAFTQKFGVPPSAVLRPADQA